MKACPHGGDCEIYKLILRFIDLDVSLVQVLFSFLIPQFTIKEN